MQSSVELPAAKKLLSAQSMPKIFSGFLNLRYPVLLDSARTDDKYGQFSYFTADPFVTLTAKGRMVHIDNQGITERIEADPLEVIRYFLRKYSSATIPGLPPFQAGLVGYISYEMARTIENLPNQAVDDLNVPDISVGIYDWVVSRNHKTGETWAIATGLPTKERSQALERLKWIESKVNQPLVNVDHMITTSPTRKPTSNFNRDTYCQAVRTIKRYIGAGDVYQVNLCQRFETPYIGNPWNLYVRLRHFNPAPFSAYMQYPESTILSSSPELFLYTNNKRITTRPIKGTRPRGSNHKNDKNLLNELKMSGKERAENVMIVDLMRNDLGKVCVPGSITVPRLFDIETHPTVFQMASTVEGELNPEEDSISILKACFPGGSVTGAPKLRAMEIIDELEPVARNVYCGAIGYIGFDGEMQTSIPIRIMMIKDQTAYLPVGSGIVADSNPEAEYRETIDKARGSMQALGVI